MSVFLTYPHAHTVKHNFSFSLAQFFKYTSEDIILSPERCYPGDDLAQGRNRSVERFLKTGAEWYWTLDTDIGFRADTLAQLLTSPGAVVSGSYTIRTEVGNDGLGGPERVIDYPVAMHEGDDNLYHPYPWYQSPGMNVDATGAGCLLVQRYVFETLGSDWFTCADGFGEDFSFCRRLGHHDIPIWLNTEAVLTHCKEVWL